MRVCYDPKMNYAAEEVCHEIGENYIKTVSTINERNELYLYSNLDFETILSGEEFTLSGDAFFYVRILRNLFLSIWIASISITNVQKCIGSIGSIVLENTSNLMT